MKANSKVEDIYRLEDEIRGVVMDFYQGDLDLMILAVHEILVNAAEHGNQLLSEKILKVKILITREYIKVIIRDEGEGFDWCKVAMDNPGEPLDESRLTGERGRGIALTRECCDRLWYNEKGNEAYLLFKRDF